jgi:hypothetical protein
MACMVHAWHGWHRMGGRAHGIAELLEILGSIINGFALPLKEEHKVGPRDVLSAPAAPAAGANRENREETAGANRENFEHFHT